MTNKGKEAQAARKKKDPARHERFSGMGKKARWEGRGDDKAPDGKGFEFFAQRMRWARERMKMSRENLAELTGFSPTSLCAYEEERQTPNANRMEDLATHLKVAAEWLFNGSGRTPAKTPTE